MSKFYFLVMDGEPVQANEGDTIHELAVAEAVLIDEQLTSEGVV